MYISGNPSQHDSEWQDALLEFIKRSIYDRKTVKEDRIRNVIVIWDNYSSSDKKTEYVKLYNKLNECNIILIGSIYSFESYANSSTIVQGIPFNELKPLQSKLGENERSKLEELLKMINQQWANQVSYSKNNYIFEAIINFAKFSYSPEWDRVKNTMKARLSQEASLTESVSNELFNIFKGKNADDIVDVTNTVLSLGIGAKTQAMFMNIDAERQRRNESFINSIRDMNLILAVAGQFNKTIKLPISILLRTIMKGKQYKGEYQKLNRILRNDSMVEYDTNTVTGSTLVSFRHPSEAIAYLDNNLGKDRKEQEIKTIIRLIENCNWEQYEEARSVSDFIRSFGTNSYGKINDQLSVRGHYHEYSEYWIEIVEKLKLHASNNPEAMLIAGHFTRDYIETHPTINETVSLNEALEGMKNALNSFAIPNSTSSRLYGEICRNILQQMKQTNDCIQFTKLSYEFEDNFQLAVKNGKESSLRNSVFSMIQLLDIWLNYFLYNEAETQYKLLPETLEYIDLLFYNESNLIDDTEDYANVLSSINQVYDIINESRKSELQRIFSNADNDSYVYCIAKQILVKLFFEYKEKYSQIFGVSKGQILSSRVFFLNENAANDFEHFKVSSSTQVRNVKEILQEIKHDLIAASDGIMRVLENEYRSFKEMSFRCLVLYLKAKWMYLTGNFLLEQGQYPALSNEQWLELNNICTTIQANAGDNDVIPRSVGFIQNIYGFVFEKKRWEQHRYNNETPVRLICLCNQNDTNRIGIPRIFHVSVEQKPNKKLFANIDHEIGDHQRKRTAIVGQRNVYVPENIRNYRELKNSNLNIDRDFVIWFNLGGPQIQDKIDNEEV